jgi:hypothetical protein
MLLNLFSSGLQIKTADFFGLKWFDEDLYTLLFRLLVNLIALTILIRFLYYPKTKRKDYLFTYYLIGLTTFFLCFSLKKLDIDTGMGLGLFAIFGIIRYRTDAIEIKEMTYLFVVIGLSVVNSLSSKKTSFAEIMFVNAAIVGITFTLERLWLLKHKTVKLITYEKIDLIKPEKYSELKADLEQRTGLKISDVKVGTINLLNDTAQITIGYYPDEQPEGYSED